ncbi:MAG: molecular chaperone HtpG [Micromonosporaceae bacterium]|nr:molecular chaperone HtpG [Micromonosporaceae bacterium]
MSTNVETLEFQAEARQLLDLMVHSVYSNKDIFLRELISNASDALDKLRLVALIDKDLAVDTSDLHIDVEPDKERRTLTVRDNGIGMSRDEVVTLIGTIAKSGTADLLRRMKESNDAAVAKDLIGQFGVGFYSTFMVSDRVTLVTRRAGEEVGTCWESQGEGTYTIEPVEDAPQGTTVTVHLKPADEEDRLFDYTEERKIREVVKRYSNFIAWPIRMMTESADTEGETQLEVVTLNSMKALWARPRAEVKDDEYKEFYKHISHDWNDPLEIIQMKAEGAFEYEALLFLPPHAPYDLFSRDSHSGVHLYVKRVFIMDDCRELMPPYLRFVKGVVDAQDLSLNMSREILQQDRQIQLMRRRLAKKVLATVRDMMAQDPDRYGAFWREFGHVVKEGLLDDPDNQGAILDISSFASTRHDEDLTTLQEYVQRMKEGQEEIYFATGGSRSTVENSPHMEAFQEGGYEVLLLTDPVDAIWVDRVPEFEGKRLQSIAKGELDIAGKDGEKADESQREQQEKEFAPLLSWLAETLKEQVKEVRLSSRLTASPACLVTDLHDMSPTLENVYRAMGQQGPRAKRILEVNPAHQLVTELRAAHEERAGDESLAEVAELLYGAAVLAEGGDLQDSARFARLLAGRLARAV